jgi:hypothetical protein
MAAAHAELFGYTHTVTYFCMAVVEHAARHRTAIVDSQMSLVVGCVHFALPPVPSLRAAAVRAEAPPLAPAGTGGGSVGADGTSASRRTSARCLLRSLQPQGSLSLTLSERHPKIAQAAARHRRRRGQPAAAGAQQCPTAAVCNLPADACMLPRLLLRRHTLCSLGVTQPPACGNLHAGLEWRLSSVRTLASHHGYVV